MKSACISALHTRGAGDVADSDGDTRTRVTVRRKEHTSELKARENPVFGFSGSLDFESVVFFSSSVVVIKLLLMRCV